MAGSVYADMKDVSLETALEMVLAGKPYVVRKTLDYYFIADMSLPESKDRRIFEERRNTSAWPQGTYLVYRPISVVLVGENRQQALMDLAAAAEVSIAVNENITGEVDADLNNVPLETAFRILLAGTPYVVEKKADHYEVTEPGKPPWPPDAANDWQLPETRRIRVNYIEAERAKSLLSSAFQPYVTPEPADTTDPNSHVLIVTAPEKIVDRIAMEIRDIDVRPRHVLLDVRIVAMERRDLPNLGIEWTQGKADRTATASVSQPDIRIGRLPDRASRDAPMAEVAVDFMENNRADIIASPQVMAKEGHPVEVSNVIT